MRIAISIAAMVLALWPAQAGAFENFIPLGQNYSPDDPVLPKFNSEQDRLNSQVDIYETEIYIRQRTAKRFSSRLDRFSYDQELKGGNEFIDY